MPAGFAASDVLSNGTNIYLATGQSYRLDQGYILNLKDVSSDGSIWLQLIENDITVKTEIVHSYETFDYNKGNRTIISVRVEKVYLGSSEQSLVSLSLYQFVDPNLPAPNKTGILPSDTQNPGSNSPPAGRHATGNAVIWVLGISFVLTLFYIVRKLW